MVDASELYHTVLTEDRFAMLRNYFPIMELFYCCRDYDTFYELLDEVVNNSEVVESVGLKLKESPEYRELEMQGADFVELYREHYILPAVRQVKGESTYLVGGLSINQQIVIRY